MCQSYRSGYADSCTLCCSWMYFKKLSYSVWLMDINNFDLLKLRQQRINKLAFNCRVIDNELKGVTRKTGKHLMTGKRRKTPKNSGNFGSFGNFPLSQISAKYTVLTPLDFKVRTKANTFSAICFGVYHFQKDSETRYLDRSESFLGRGSHHNGRFSFHQSRKTRPLQESENKRESISFW